MNIETYIAWVKANVDAETGGYGKCEEVVTSMAEAFPELEPRKGFFHSTAWGQRGHHWLRHRETQDIVDPTARQHPDGSVFPGAIGAARYEDLTDKTDEEMAEVVPTGVCMECSAPCYRGDTFCSDACGSTHIAWMNAGCPMD